MAKSSIDMVINLCNDKYKLVHYKTGGMEALRYGEKWRDLTGDNLILALMQEYFEMKNRIDSLEERLANSKEEMYDLRTSSKD